ncbi:hypothetical protein MMC19_001435 [Ptychographa xylographoides]|nr:hypothetical protein [Ptychographa xylographoides]
MDFRGDLIWGDENESEVFAQAQSLDLRVIFRYSLSPKLPQSLPNRIVTCYHNLPAKDASETFLDRVSMREELYSSIYRVWDQCVMHPSITAPDVTVEIYEDAGRQSQWRISHESLYNQYTESLLPASSLLLDREAKLHVYNYVDYSRLAHISHLGGRGRTAVVHSSLDSETLYVFKGIDFGAFLESRADFEHQKDVFYHEIRTIASLPRHPNIIPPPTTFVAVGNIKDGQHDLICGTLYPFMERGTLDDQVRNTKATGARITLIDKAVWCFQMTSAIAHTHFAAHTFHMDIKPANFVVNANKDLILIDWEQSGAPSYTLAPEADGTWDIKDLHEGADSAKPELVYEKYRGPYRENLAWGRPKWNVFPIWRESFPRALEAAEIFSLGQTMWMLLEQVAQSEVEDLDNVIVFWSEAAKDIPDAWKKVVCRCLDIDPNKRITLLELVNFWEAAKYNH